MNELLEMHLRALSFIVAFLFAAAVKVSAIGNSNFNINSSNSNNSSGSVSGSTSTANIEHDVLHFSYTLQQWLDAEQRPCSNFYGYVCGRTVNTTQAQTTRILQQKQRNFEQFLAADNEEELLDAELKLKHFFVSCQNARSTEDLKSSLMYRVSGGWPAVDDSDAMILKRRNMTWLDVLGALHEVGVQYVFRQRVEIKSNRRLVLLEPDTNLRYTLRKYEQLVGEVLQAHAVDVGRARLVALETLSFERNRRELLHKDMLDEPLELSYDSFKSLFERRLQPEWDAYFRKIFGKPPKANDTILLRQLPKLMEAFQLLQNTTMTRLLNWIWIDYLMDKTIDNCQALVESYFAPIYQHIVQRSGVEKVQMAQMYSELGRVYNEVLAPSPWIDEMSQLNSMQMLGRVIHMTLNGDSTLDADYRELTITKRNFYRNLEKVQRHLALKRRQQNVGLQEDESSMQLAGDYMKVLLLVNILLQQQQNLSTPLNYALVGESFAEHMIAAGSSSNTPGAWRSMDSEREFGVFRQCVTRQQSSSNSAVVNSRLNDLILKLLAQQQALQAFTRWQQTDAMLTRRLDSLLAAGRLQLSLRKLYFVGGLLTQCRQLADAEQEQLLQSYLQNSPEFTQAFRCRAGDAHFARNPCKVL